MTHDWEWFIPPIKMVISGMVYGIVLPTFYSMEPMSIHLNVKLMIANRSHSFGQTELYSYIET